MDGTLTAFEGKAGQGIRTGKTGIVLSVPEFSVVVVVDVCAFTRTGCSIRRPSKQLIAANLE
jgi:hypothetical protein